MCNNNNSNDNNNNSNNNSNNNLLFVRRKIAFNYDLMRSMRKHQFPKTAYFYGKMQEFVGEE